MSLNGGYAMIKYNSTQEELQIAYRSKKPVLFYDENQRSHWAVIEEKATESVDEETQEPITLYEYSYRLIDEASSVVANPTLSGDESNLTGLEVDGTKYKVGGGKLFEHTIKMQSTISTTGDRLAILNIISYSNIPKNWNDVLNYCVNLKQATGCVKTTSGEYRIYGIQSNLEASPARIEVFYKTSFYDNVAMTEPYSLTDTITEV